MVAGEVGTVAAVMRLGVAAATTPAAGIAVAMVEDTVADDGAAEVGAAAGTGAAAHGIEVIGAGASGLGWVWVLRRGRWRQIRCTTIRIPGG